MEILKSATRQAVAAAGGPLAVSRLLHVSEETARRWGASGHPEFVPLRHLPQLEAAGPSLHVTRALARLQGAALVETAPAVAAASAASRLAQVGSDAGEVFARAVVALADHAIDREEAAGLVTALGDLAEAAAEAIAALVQR